MGCGASQPPIFDLIDKGDPHKIRDMVRAKPNAAGAVDADGNTAVHHCVNVERGDDCPCLQAILVSTGVQLNAVNKDGWSPLHRAAMLGKTGAMSELLKAGAKEKLFAPGGQTALHLAAQWNQAACIQAGLNCLISVDLPNERQESPLHVAAASGHLEPVQVLLKGKANASLASVTGRTPLHEAAANGHLEILQALLQAGADLPAKDSDGRTALQLADAAGHTKCSQKLGAAPKEEDIVRGNAVAVGNGGAYTAGDPEGLMPANDATRKRVQDLMDETWLDKTTRDRQYGKVARFEVVQVLQNSNSKQWAEYVKKRDDVALHYVETIDNMKTVSAAWEADLQEPRKTGVNEFFLFHGTKPDAAKTICERTHFRVDLSGSNKGSLYGPGIYFAESSAKADEYAMDDDREDGLYKGLFAMLLCRVTLGNPVKTTEVEPDVPKLAEALACDDHHSILGDREAARGTFREFIVRDANQAYPAYAVIYRRKS